MSNIDLIKEYKAGNLGVKEKIIENNKGLVRKIAFHYAAGQYDDLEDYIQEGYIGVLTALEHFDINKDLEFSTYAVWWIKQKIIRYFQDTGRSVRIPVHTYVEIGKIKKAMKNLQQLNGREPSIHEIAASMNEDEDKIIELLDISRTIMSLDAPMDIVDSESSTYGDIIPDNSPSPEDIAVQNELNRNVRLILNNALNADEQKFINLKFGFDGECYTNIKLSKMYGVTRQGITEKEKRIFRKLRRRAEIIQLKKDMKIDEKTNFYRKGRNPVLSNVLKRDHERKYLDIKYDHPFYMWYFELLSQRVKIISDIDYCGQDELDELEFKIDVVKQSLIYLMFDESILLGRKIVNDKLEGKQTFEYSTVIESMDLRIQELKVIDLIIDILRLNNIYVDVDEQQVPVFYK